MQKGKRKLENLTSKQKDNLINDIINHCITYAGDSYDDYGRKMVKELVSLKLVDYGYACVETGLELTEDKPF